MTDKTYQQMVEIRRLAHDARSLLHQITTLADEVQQSIKQAEKASINQHEAEDSHLMDQYDTMHGDLADQMMEFYDEEPDIYSGTYSEE